METKDIIKAGRQRLGMTHQAFADAVGVSRGAVQQREKGDTAPTRRHQPRVAAILDISVGELMGHVAIEEGAPARSEPAQSQFQIQSQLFAQQAHSVFTRTCAIYFQSWLVFLACTSFSSYNTPMPNKTASGSQHRQASPAGHSQFAR